MRLFSSRTSKTAGLPPGTLLYTGDKTEEVKITVFDYDSENFSEKTIESVDECCEYKDNEGITWINVDGIHDVTIVEKLGEIFELHPLILEDIVNVDQRPKYEEFDDNIFIVARMFRYDEKSRKVTYEQVSLILGKDWVLSFQEIPGDVFESIRDRIRTGKGRIRKVGADYLFYTLLDAVVDSYFSVFERIGEHIAELEDQVLEDPNDYLRRQIHILKRELIFLRKSIWPMRDIASSLQRGQNIFLTEATELYIRDLYDHVAQVIDTLETYREMASSMLDTYLSVVSNRMNEIMKVLTIFAAIFIPLTFIAGIYGMNFEHMPELSWKWGYAAVWGVMLTVGLSLVIFFKRKNWL